MHEPNSFIAYSKVENLLHYRTLRINLVWLTTSDGATTLPSLVLTRAFLKTQFTQFTNFYRKVNKDNDVNELDFATQSVHSMSRHDHDFKCY